RSKRDWSSDVCSSDLDDVQIFLIDVAQVEAAPVRVVRADGDQLAEPGQRVHALLERLAADVLDHDVDAALAGPLPDLVDEVRLRSEERRVGKECKSRW